MKKVSLLVMGALGLTMASCTNAGDPCTKNEECDSGYCIKVNGQKQCAATCKRNNCTGNMECRHTVPGDTGNVGICMPVNSKACGICENDKDCPIGAFCMPDGGEKYCLSDCGFTKECAEGYQCQSAEREGKAVGMLCMPNTGSCACDKKKIGNQRTCYKTNDIGTCEGVEQCDGQAWVGCTAPDAVEEICDGVDNDCDGEIDEQISGAPIDRDCEINRSGLVNVLPECTGGKEFCSLGNWGACTLPANHGFTAKTMPAKEMYCDGIDDNCDGQRDEGLTGTGEYCSSCQDHCPPGLDDEDNGIFKHAIRRCNKKDIISQSKCQKAKCEFPYFDNDGDLNTGWNARVSDADHYSKYNDRNNGCEVKDNTIPSGEFKGLLNNTPEKAISLGSINSNGSKTFCNGYLPKDDKENHNLTEIAEGEEGYIDPTSAQGSLGGPMATDYYTMTIDFNMSDLNKQYAIDMYVTFSIPEVYSEDDIAQMNVEFSTLSGSKKAVFKSFAVSDSPASTKVARFTNVISKAQKGDVILIKIFLNEQMAGVKFPYHIGFAVEDLVTGVSVSPLPLHACPNG